MNEPRFRPGDMVRIRERGRSAAWCVIADDTNQTPVRDPEPAYRLRKFVGRTPDGRCIERYAYESDLVRA
jgi:hypothetical protein